MQSERSSKVLFSVAHHAFVCSRFSIKLGGGVTGSKEMIPTLNEQVFPLAQVEIRISCGVCK